MKIITLAKTPNKESCSVDGKLFYTEYSVACQLSYDEKCELSDRWGMRQQIYKYEFPVITIRRHVDIMPDGTIVYGEYEYFDAYGNIQEAALKFMDSEYYHNVESLSFIYDSAIELWKMRSKLETELNQLTDSITPCKFARSSSLQEKYESLLISQLKEARLYSKALKNIAPQDKLDAIKKPLEKQYKQEYSRIIARIDEIKNQLSLNS